LDGATDLFHHVVVAAPWQGVMGEGASAPRFWVDG